MIFAFDYKPVRKRFLPIIPLTIKRGDKFLEIEAYVDSGASISTFSVEIANFLGIDFLNGKEVFPLGTAGRIRAYVKNVELEINGIEVNCKAMFSKEFASKFNLLGMHGVFDKFKITFDNKNKKVAFEEH